MGHILSLVISGDIIYNERLFIFSSEISYVIK